jgi:hypothetical protein
MDLEHLSSIEPWQWPAESRDLLLDVLREPGAPAEDRLLAAELSSESVVMDDAIANALLGILGSRDAAEELRGQAAISLGPVLELADIDGFDDLDDVPISEQTFRQIVESLERLFADQTVPTLVRRRILESSVRAARDWHENAVRSAYASDDADWKLTAVFAMRWIRGFDKEILESLTSTNEKLRYEAMCAAGNWEIDAAWPQIVEVIESTSTDKALLLAAIEAAAAVRPDEAGPLLVELTDSEDDDIVDAAHEAMAMAEAAASDDFELDED